MGYNSCVLFAPAEIGVEPWGNDNEGWFGRGDWEHADRITVEISIKTNDIGLFPILFITLMNLVDVAYYFLILR